MKRGCLGGFFETVGCLTVLVVAVAVGWYFRAELAAGYRGAAAEFQSPTVESEIVGGTPSRSALETAEQREVAIASADGPGFVVFSTDEIASLLDVRLDPDARRALDSIRVIAETDRLTVEGQLLTEVFGRDLLGPLARIIDRREPIRLSGPVRIRTPGVMEWQVDQFSVHSFPFPKVAIPRLIDRLSGKSEGVLLVSVPAMVGDIRVRVEGVTFYRRVD